MICTQLVLNGSTLEGISMHVVPANSSVDQYTLLLSFTTTSCLLFGAITDERVCFVINAVDDDSKEFDRFMAGIQSLLKEQVSEISAFNTIR